MDKEYLEEKFGRTRSAYKSLFIGSLELLELDSIYWTERILLKIVHTLSKQRLVQIKNVFPSESKTDNEKRLKENMLEAQVEAALGGHNLGEWEQLEEGQGYQAACSNCGGTVFVSHKTFYSILQEKCPTRK